MFRCNKMVTCTQTHRGTSFLVKLLLNTIFSVCPGLGKPASLQDSAVLQYIYTLIHSQKDK